MKKIIGYKLHLVKRDILHMLKEEHGIAEPAADVMQVIDHELDVYPNRLKPAALFETFSKQTIPQPLENLLANQPDIPSTGSDAGNIKRESVAVQEDVQLALWDDCVAVSFCAVTIGDVTNAGSPLTGSLSSLFARASLAAAERFIYSLIKDEAAKDDCQLGARRFVGDISVLRAVPQSVDYPKINISIHEDGSIHPPFTRFMLVNWIPT